jgi:hypothetical protein
MPRTRLLAFLRLRVRRICGPQIRLVKVLLDWRTRLLLGFHRSTSVQSADLDPRQAHGWAPSCPSSGAKAPMAGTSHDLIRWPCHHVTYLYPSSLSAKSPRPVLPCQETSNSCADLGIRITSFHIRARTDERSQVYQIDLDNETTSHSLRAPAFHTSTVSQPKVRKVCLNIMHYSGGRHMQKRPSDAERKPRYQAALLRECGGIPCQRQEVKTLSCSWYLLWSFLSYNHVAISLFAPHVTSTSSFHSFSGWCCRCYFRLQSPAAPVMSTSYTSIIDHNSLVCPSRP